MSLNSNAVDSAASAAAAAAAASAGGGGGGGEADTQAKEQQQQQQQQQQQDQQEHSLECLKIVSMNLSECRPSAEAPDFWDRGAVSRTVRDEIARTDPDIVALQECPNRTTKVRGVENWLHRVFGLDGYTSMGTAPSHAGYVALLLKDALAKQATRIVPTGKGDDDATDGGDDLPAVMVQLTDRGHRRNVVVASCHLAPFADNAHVRKRQMEIMVRASFPYPIIVAGDTNMRVQEDDDMERDFGLQDGWKLAGSDPHTKYTWDTQDHRSAPTQRRPPSVGGGGGGDGEGTFNRYYGDDTREYCARYDRVYIHDASATAPPGVNYGVSSIGSNQSSAQRTTIVPSVPSFQLVANTPIPPSKTHFLSDHFGIAATIRLHWRGGEKQSHNPQPQQQQRDDQLLCQRYNVDANPTTRVYAQRRRGLD